MRFGNTDWGICRSTSCTPFMFVDSQKLEDPRLRFPFSTFRILIRGPRGGRLGRPGVTTNRRYKTAKARRPTAEHYRSYIYTTGRLTSRTAFSTSSCQPRLGPSCPPGPAPSYRPTGGGQVPGYRTRPGQECTPRLPTYRRR